MGIINPASTLSRNNAWIFTCDSWARENTYIILPVNPGEFNVTLPIRKTQEAYRSTKMTYIWRDTKFKSVFDTPVLEFTVSSGNALPIFNDTYVSGVNFASLALASESDDASATKSTLAYITERYSSRFPGSDNHEDVRSGLYANVGSAATTDSSTDNSVHNRPDLYYSDLPIGIQNLYAFHALIDERKLVHVFDSNGNKTSDHTDNRCVITVNTLAFPRLLVYGWFAESGLSVSESVDSFGEVTCSFSFIVTDTYPRLSFNHWERLMASYSSEMGSTQSSLDWTRLHLGLSSQITPATAKPETRINRADASASDQLA